MVFVAEEAICLKIAITLKFDCKQSRDYIQVYPRKFAYGRRCVLAYWQNFGRASYG